MLRRLLSLFILVALLGSLLPPSTCMGFGKPCCCSGHGEGEGDLDSDTLEGGGCTCGGPEMSSCSPGALAATAPEAKAAPFNPTITLLMPGGHAHAAVTTANPAIATTTSDPPLRPSLALLGCLRI